MDLKCALIIPDTHRPFHHVKAYNLMLEVASDLKSQLNEIVVLGDYADFYSVSSHSRDPRVFHMLQDEVVDVLAGLSELDHLFPDAKKVFLQGNHEFRLERYLVDKAPALFGITDTRFLLGFDQRPNWRYIPYGPNQSHKVLGSYLRARHEPLASSAKATAAKALCSIVYGHIHRIESSHIVGMDGTNHIACSVGWLGDKSKDLIYSYVKNHHQWQMGFGLCWVDQKNKFFHLDTVHILEDGNQVSCVVNGKLYKS